MKLSSDRPQLRGGPERRRKGIILVSCCLSLLIVSMDATIVNVAIPNIRADLHASASQLQWVIDIYTLVLASLLLLSGATADRFGRRRTFQIGLTVFAIGSLLCSLSPNIETLIIARMVQAVGGSMLNPVAMSIITQVFTGRVERARAIGIWGGVVGISMALGPIVGGALIQVVDWRAVFWINLPICAAAIVLTAIFVPESRSATMRDVDPVGQGLGMTFLFGVVYVLIEGPLQGLDRRPHRRRWRRRAAGLRVVPALRVAPTRSLHRPSVLPQHPVRVSDDDRGVCVRRMGCVPVPDVAVPAGRARLLGDAHRTALPACCRWRADLLAAVGADWSAASAARPSLLIAGTLITAATLMLTRLTATTAVWQLLVFFAVFGIGFSMVNAPITNAAVSGMPTDRAGAASAVASTSRQVGVSLGVALCGSVAGAAIATSGADFAIAARPLWLICAGLALLIIALAVYSTSARALRSAERLAPLVAGPDVRLKGADVK